MRCVVLANGDPAGSDVWGAEQLKTADLLIAADGGAATALKWGRVPDVVVGDLDSAGASTRRALQSAGSHVISFPRDKDQTDTELALITAVRRGATAIDVLGALGGPRLDHALANVFLLGLPAVKGVTVVLRDERHEVRLLRGNQTLSLTGRTGDILTLIPVTATVTGVTTRGLLYPLRSATLRFGEARGVSNELTGTRASLTLSRGRLLAVVHRIAH